MRREYIIYRRRNWRGWVAALCGVLGTVTGLSLSWSFILSLIVGAGLAMAVYSIGSRR